MANLTDLPRELIDDIASHLTLSEIIALRHTSKQLVVNTTHSYRQAFSTIKVTCSKKGLARLGNITDFAGWSSNAELITKRAVCDSVEHVVIHVLSASRLVELAGESKSNFGRRANSRGRSLIRGCLTKMSIVDSPYMRAYAYMRNTLVQNLNKLPNSKTITITNEDSSDMQEPVLEISKLSRFDPLPHTKPHLYAYESVLSIFPALAKTDVRLEVVVDYANTIENDRLAVKMDSRRRKRQHKAENVRRHHFRPWTDTAIFSA